MGALEVSRKSSRLITPWGNEWTATETQNNGQGFPSLPEKYWSVGNLSTQSERALKANGGLMTAISAIHVPLLFKFNRYTSWAHSLRGPFCLTRLKMQLLARKVSDCLAMYTSVLQLQKGCDPQSGAPFNSTIQGLWCTNTGVRWKKVKSKNWKLNGLNLNFVGGLLFDCSRPANRHLNYRTKNSVIIAAQNYVADWLVQHADASERNMKRACPLSNVSSFGSPAEGRW